MSSTGLYADSLLSDCTAGQAWQAPAGLTGSGAEIVFDLHCKQSLHGIQILNSYGDLGTESFILWGARSEGGQWRKLKEGKLGKRLNEVGYRYTKNRLYLILGLQ